LNLRISRAYLLKEQFRHLWQQRSRHDAAAFLEHCITMAMESQLRPLHEFASLLSRHREGVLAYFELPIDNGLVEAINASAKAISIRARGYRSPVVFSTLLLHCLGGLKTPTFVHKFA
jgi:transposase